MSDESLLLARLFLGVPFIVWGILKMVMGIRVSEQEEYEGVDQSECGMEAYPEFVGASGSGR